MVLLLYATHPVKLACMKWTSAMTICISQVGSQPLAHPIPGPYCYHLRKNRLECGYRSNCLPSMYEALNKLDIHMPVILALRVEADGLGV